MYGWLRAFFTTLAVACAAHPSAHHQHSFHRRQDLLQSLSGLLNVSSDIVHALANDISNALSTISFSDALRTPVSVSGAHAFVPPSSTDQRGPCPGLNALANHGYIPHDGIVSLVEVVPAIVEVYGMGADLALALGLMGLLWTGDPLSLDPKFSIGGSDARVSNILDNLEGLLGTPEGLDHSHNFIESDGSPTRNDLYLTGDAWTMNLTRFKAWDASVSKDSFFDLDVMAAFAAQRYHESIAENPYFYYGPFTGMIARTAGFLFVARLFANYTTASTSGELTHDTLRSFFAVTNTSTAGTLSYTPGHERIPSNFHHTPTPYTLASLNLDVVSWIQKYPELASIGGNTGSVNSFAGIDLTHPVTGISNVANLLEGNNLLCFALEVVKLAAPSYMSNLFSSLTVPLELLNGVLEAPLLSLACPVWEDLTYNGKPIWETLLSEFEGAKKSGSAL